MCGTLKAICVRWMGLFLILGRPICVVTQVVHNYACLNSGETILANLSDLKAGQSFRFFSHREQYFNLDYPRNYECNFEFLLGDRCEKMHLTCSHMDVDGDFEANCIGQDRLHFIDNFNSFQESYCGQVKPNYTTIGQAIFLSFRSTLTSQSGKGFRCEVRCLDYDKDGSSQSGGNVPKDQEILPCKCGRANRRQRIIGGTVTKVNEYPWQVAIVKWNKTQPFCGGALVDDEWVMTAAHCTQGFTPDQIQVVLGEHDHTIATETAHIVMDVVEIHDHPRYNGFHVDYDFSLLRLSRALDFSHYDHILPVCLPSLSPTPNGAEVKLELFPMTTCRKLLGKDDVTDQMICAGNLEGGKDACQGDSGGPLTHKRDSHNYHLIGITSWGFGCGRRGLPGVYANVLSTRSWWQSYIQETACPKSNEP
eukprot:TCALIF_02556-PA protein Name:"Similar to TRYP7 Trypsin-7 (Anopheles gambiae)" AED:0.33 eAED:0.33 QI:45/0.87/1/1/0.87/0.77/9/193/421